MANAGAPDPGTLQVDSKTYWLAQDRTGRYIHDIISSGQDLREEWDFREGSWGMGETVRKTATGYYFTDSMDCTRRGIRLSPTVNTVAVTSVPQDQHPPQFFEENDLSSNRYTYMAVKKDANEWYIYKINNSTGALRNTRTFPAAPDALTTNNTPCRPERFNGSWFLPVDIAGSGSGASSAFAFQRLVTIQTDTSDDDWDETSAGVALRGCFLIDLTSGTPKFGRVRNQNVVQTVETSSVTAPLTEANWADAGTVGDTTGWAQGFASHAGITIIGKPDNAYAWDPTGQNYPIITALKRTTTTDPDSASTGFGLLSYGSQVLYSHPSGLYVIEFISSVQNRSVDKIQYFTPVPNITAPIRLRYFEGALWGDWIYWVYTSAEQSASTSYILALQLKRHPTSGLEAIWHTVITRSNQIRGLFIDSRKQLWWAEPGQNRLAFIQLAQDGSPDNQTARGNVSSTYEWYGPEVDFGLPEITKQLRYAFVELESGTANASWQFKAHRDSGTADSIGSAITTATGTNINWTVGTTDTCRRVRPRFTVTTNGSHSSATNPAVVRLILYARSLDRWRAVITEQTSGSTRNIFEDAKILRKLKDAGPVTIREADTNETFSGYIRQVNNITNTDGSRALEVLYERYSVAV